MKSVNTKTVLGDGKKLSGKGHLTEKFINKLQNNYGIAIRSSCHGNVYSLRKVMAAVLYYCSEAPSLEAQHQFFPTGVDSWCRYHDDKETYKPKPGLPAAIREFIRPLFVELSDENLLSKCLHGKTRNSNESINGVIWKRCPKDVFVGRKVLEMGVASAVISFNDRTKQLIDVMKELKVEPGHYSETYYNYKNFYHVKSMENKKTVETKSRRKKELTGY